MRKVLILFPLLALPVLVYMLIAISAGNGTASPPILFSLESGMINMPMLSGVKWFFSLGDALLFFGLLMLFAEIVKATSTKAASIMNHAASMLLLMLCLIAFLLLKNFATATFFLLTTMCFLDVLAGVMVTIVSARRDFGVH